ncbi:hypothetical protein IAS59_005055 [Cryptococcus gattii]
MACFLTFYSRPYFASILRIPMSHALCTSTCTWTLRSPPLTLLPWLLSNLTASSKRYSLPRDAYPVSWASRRSA